MLTKKHKASTSPKRPISTFPSAHSQMITVEQVTHKSTCASVEYVISMNRSDFSALCSRLGFMRIPGEIPMKVLMTKGFLATRSHASKPCLSLRELAGTRFTSMPVMPGGTGRRNRYQTFFSFTCFHGPSAARPLGWPLRMTNGKVRDIRLSTRTYRLRPARPVPR
jgi:hypothetical protein